MPSGCAGLYFRAYFHPAIQHQKLYFYGCFLGKYNIFTSNFKTVYRNTRRHEHIGVGSTFLCTKVRLRVLDSAAVHISLRISGYF